MGIASILLKKFQPSHHWEPGAGTATFNESRWLVLLRNSCRKLGPGSASDSLEPNLGTSWRATPGRDDMLSHVSPMATAVSDRSNLSWNQFSGRNIHDNFITTQQSVRALHCRSVPTLMIKLDIARAFDTVRPFLLAVLQRLGFS